MPLVVLALESNERDFTDYIKVDKQSFTASFIRTPKFAEVPYQVQMQPDLVIEFYSR